MVTWSPAKLRKEVGVVRARAGGGDLEAKIGQPWRIEMRFAVLWVLYLCLGAQRTR